MTEKTEVFNCEKHGEYELRTAEVFGQTMRFESCPLCADEKAAEEDQRAQQEAAEQAKAVKRGMLEKSGLPVRYQRTTFDGFDTTGSQAAGKALRAVLQFCDDWDESLRVGRNLLLCGSTGTGKTHLAAAAIRRLIGERLIQPRYTTASGFLRELRSTFNDDGQSEQDVYREYGTTPLLVLDEIGVKYSTDYERAALFELIDIRYGNELPSILISNLTIGELQAVLDERTLDRLSHRGAVIPFQWKSYRAGAA